MPGSFGLANGLWARKFLATGSNRLVGTIFPANGSRIHVPDAFCRVENGSYIGRPCPLNEKSPLYIASVGTVRNTTGCPPLCRNAPKVARKNVLFRPL